MHQICLLGLVYTGSPKRHMPFRSFWPLVLSQCSCQFDTVELPWLLTMDHIQPNNNLWVFINAKCPPHPPRTPKNHVFLKIQCYPAQMDTELIFSEFFPILLWSTFFFNGQGHWGVPDDGFQVVHVLPERPGADGTPGPHRDFMAISWTKIHQGFSRYISYGMIH